MRPISQQVLRVHVEAGIFDASCLGRLQACLMWSANRFIKWTSSQPSREIWSYGLSLRLLGQAFHGIIMEHTIDGKLG
jgi:hypothetical protein